MKTHILRHDCPCKHCSLWRAMREQIASCRMPIGEIMEVLTVVNAEVLALFEDEVDDVARQFIEHMQLTVRDIQAKQKPLTDEEKQLHKEVAEAQAEELPPMIAELIKTFKAQGAQVHVINPHNGKERRY